MFFTKVLRLGRAGAAFAHESGLFDADDRELFGFGIFLKPVEIFLGYRHVGEYGFDGTFRQTGIAVDTGVGIDEQAVGRFVKGLDGADGGAVCVFTIYARRNDNIGHELKTSPSKSARKPN